VASGHISGQERGRGKWQGPAVAVAAAEPDSPCVLCALCYVIRTSDSGW
jgi:hypothetical protein